MRRSGAIQRRCPRRTRPSAGRGRSLLLRSPKGWTGPAEIDGVPIEGTFRAHQVPAKDAATNPEHLRVLETWLRSYRPEELFDADGCPEPDILAACPAGDRRIGMNPHTRGWQRRRALALPPLAEAALPVAGPGQTTASALEHAGAYLAESAPAQRGRAQLPHRLPGRDDVQPARRRLHRDGPRLRLAGR